MTASPMSIHTKNLAPPCAADNLRVMILASGDLWAGAEAVVYTLCSGLVKHTRTEVTAVFLNEGALADRCREAGVSVHVIDESRYDTYALIKHTLSLARSVQPHVIHAHRYKENMVALVMKLFLRKMRLISTVHGRFEHQGGLKQTVLNRINAFFLGRAFSCVVAVSHDLKGYLIHDLRMPKSKVRCVTNGIGAGSRARTDLMTGETITIGSAGRLFPVKDYPLMIEAARDVCRLNDNMRFVLAGDGPEMEQLRSRIKELGIEEKFRLLGHVRDMDGFYRSIDIYLNTSKHEGMPVTVLEAMSYGIPVIAPGVGGLKELISNGEEGFLVSERSGSAFADALIRMSEDRQSARAMGMNARWKIYRDFSSEKMVKDYVALYTSSR